MTECWFNKQYQNQGFNSVIILHKWFLRLSHINNSQNALLSRKDIHILLSYKRSHISLFIAAKENVLCLQHNDTEIWCLYVYYLISSSYINIINNKNMYTINSDGVIMWKWMMVKLTFLTQNWWKWIGWLKRRL